MAKIFKNIKSLFVVDESGSSDAEASKVESKKPAGGTSKSAPSTSTPIPPSGPVKSSQKFTDILFSALEKNNLEGFDYFEYKQSLQSLNKMDMDEATKYKSAFAMAQTVGANKKKLEESGQYYLEILSKEKAKFDEAAKGQQERQVTSKSAEIQKLDALIQEREKQIKAMTAEIEQSRKLMGQRQKEIDSASVKVQQTKKVFDVSYTLLINQIQEDLKNIKTYLK